MSPASASLTAEKAAPVSAGQIERRLAHPKFTGALTITSVEAEWRVWRLEMPLVYAIGGDPARRIIVPSGYYTDGASVPRYLWGILPTWGRYSRAAVVHDYLCSRLNKGVPHPFVRTRHEADRIFLEAMGACGVNILVRYLMWGAVRLAAWWTGRTGSHHGAINDLYNTGTFSDEL